MEEEGSENAAKNVDERNPSGAQNSLNLSFEHTNTILIFSIWNIKSKC